MPAIAPSPATHLSCRGLIPTLFPGYQLVNRPADVVDETLDGLVVAFPHLKRLAGLRCLVRADIARFRHEQVSVVCGGGSGHEPAHAGYIGAGMLSGIVAGDIFASPPAGSILALLRWYAWGVLEFSNI